MNGDNNQQQQKTVTAVIKTPTPIIVFSILLFAIGAWSFLGGVIFLLMANVVSGLGEPSVDLLMNVSIFLLIPFAQIIIAIGLRKMKKWSMYMIFWVTAIGISLFIYRFIVRYVGLTDYLSNLLQIIIVVYILKIRNKFIS